MVYKVNHHLSLRIHSSLSRELIESFPSIQIFTKIFSCFVSKQLQWMESYFDFFYTRGPKANGAEQNHKMPSAEITEFLQ